MLAQDSFYRELRPEELEDLDGTSWQLQRALTASLPKFQYHF